MKGALVAILATICIGALAMEGAQSISGRSFLIVTNDMRDAYVPGNIRAADLAKTLQNEGGSVVLVAKTGDFAPEFRRSLESVGVELVAPSVDEGSFTDSLLRERQFDTAFLYLWFWGRELSAPQTYIPSIRHYSPQTKIVVVTDDAHSTRTERLNAANAQLTEPVMITDFQPDEFEVYSRADAVVTVSESDEAILRAAAAKGAFSTPIQTVHWGHSLSNLAIPTAEDVPAFGSRSGLVFVGFGRNPSNKIGLSWFLQSVWPQLSSAAKEETIYVVGSGHAIPDTQARVEVVSRKDHRALRTLLNTARAMIAPGFSTGVSTKVLLGLSAGLPVVATQDSAAGFKWAGQEALFADAMVVASSASEFAAAIDRLATDPVAWSRLSAGGLALASAQLKSGRFEEDVKTLVSGLTLQNAAPRTQSSLLTAWLTPSELRTKELTAKSRHSYSNANFETFSGTGGTGATDPCLWQTGQVLLLNIGLDPSISQIKVNGSGTGCGCGNQPKNATYQHTLADLTPCASPGAVNLNNPLCAYAAGATFQTVQMCYCRWVAETAVVTTANTAEVAFFTDVSLFLETGGKPAPTCCGWLPCSGASGAGGGGKSTGGHAASSTGYNFGAASSVQANLVVVAVAALAAFVVSRQ